MLFLKNECKKGRNVQQISLTMTFTLYRSHTPESIGHTYNTIYVSLGFFWAATWSDMDYNGRTLQPPKKTKSNQQQMKCPGTFPVFMPLISSNQWRSDNQTPTIGHWWHILVTTMLNCSPKQCWLPDHAEVGTH